MAVKADPANAPEYSKWSIEELEAEAAKLAKVRTNVRLTQLAVDAALSAARAIDGLSPEQRAAFAARAASAKE